MEGTGFLGAHAAEVYRLAEDDLYLVGTSEVPLAGYHADEILDASSCRCATPGSPPASAARPAPTARTPAASSGCTGSTRSRCSPTSAAEDAADEHQRLLAWEREFIDKLELAYRVIDVAAGDLGASAARKFDIEAWFPSQGAYRELTSTSNCTTFQARRLNIAHPDGGRHRAGRHAERHAVRRRPHDRLPARPPPAARRLGVRAGRAAAVARRARGCSPAVTRVTRPRMVATDLDGTLLRSDGTVSTRIRAALRAAADAGLLVVFVTGRPPRWLDEVVDRPATSASR